MFKKIVLSLLTSCFVLVSVNASQITMPDEFYVISRWMSLTRTFDIETKQYRLGYVHRKFFSLLPQYDFYDLTDQLQAKARMRFFSFGAIFDVTDAADAPIGTVEQKVFTFFPTFTMISPAGEILATAKLNFWGTRYTITSPLFQQPIATLYRPFFRLKDDWTVSILEREAFLGSKIDPRLFIVVMAFQTDMDYWRALQNNQNNSGGNKTVSMMSLEHPEDMLIKSQLVALREKFNETEITKAHYLEAEQIADSYISHLDGDAANRAAFMGACAELIQLVETSDVSDQLKAALLQYAEALYHKVK